MHTRRHFISAVTAALGGSVFAADGKPKTIVLQSAWDTINIGDIGHTPGTLRVIEQHLPEAKVIVWAMKVDERILAMLKARFPKVEFLQGKLDGKSEKDLKLQDAIKNCDFFGDHLGCFCRPSERCGQLVLIDTLNPLPSQCMPNNLVG